jgi:HlyD family secretion protein
MKMHKDKPIIINKPRPKKSKRDFSLTIFVLVVLAFLIAIPAYIFIPKNKVYKLDNYTYTTVKEATFREFVRATGSVKAKESWTPTSRYKGKINNVYINSGDEVKKGDLLLKLTSPELENSLKEQKELLAKAKVELEKAKIDADLELQKIEWSIREQEKAVRNAQENLEEKELMYSLGTTSKRALEEAQSALLTAKEELFVKQKNVEKTKLTNSLAIDAATTQIRVTTEKLAELEKISQENTLIAPFSGKVLEIAVKTDEEINAGALLLKLVTVDNPFVEVKITAQEADRVNEGMKANVKIAGRTHQGVIEKLSYAISADKGSAHILADIVFLADPGFILPTTEAQAEIETGRRDNIICLPRGPYVTSGQNMFVYKIIDGKALRTDVTYGAYDGNLIEIKRGLNQGDIVITSSYEAYKDQKEIIVNLEGGRAND